LYSIYHDTKDPLISKFVSGIPDTFSRAVNICKESFNVDIAQQMKFNNMIHSGINYDYTRDDVILGNRRALGKMSRKFHLEADTMDSAVARSIATLSNPETKIFVSTHQPNLFAYGGVFRKILLIHTLKNTLQNYTDNSFKIVDLFLIVDHDFMNERWIRLAQLPSVRHDSGILDLRISINRDNSRQLVCNRSLPAIDILDYWKKQLNSWIKNSPLFDAFSGIARDNSFTKSDLMENLERFWNIVERSYNKAKTYADFNSFLISNIVNRIWKYDTLLVRLTDLSPVFYNGYKNLIVNFSKYASILRETEDILNRFRIPIHVSPNSRLAAPIWLHCKCGSKASVNINKSHMRVILEGKCHGCKKNLSICLTIDDKSHFILDNQLVNAISPRAIPIPIMLLSELGISCYASGIDGIRYLIYGSHLFEKLPFVKQKPPLFIVWTGTDNYNGFAQCEALKTLHLDKQSDIAKYIETLELKESRYKDKIRSLIVDRDKKVKGGFQVNDTLSSLFILKQDQRRLRMLIKIAHKASSAVSIRPSIIDYAVNFGLENTELQWRHNLLNNDELSKPVNLIINH
jgi:hypothetical protein